MSLPTIKCCCRLIACLWCLVGGGLLMGAQPNMTNSWLVPGGARQLRIPVRVLLAGDSLMASLGPQMRATLRGYGNLTCIPIGKGSTGLARPDFYDWPRVLKEHLVKDKPHVVVMWIGTNDSQDIYGMPNLGGLFSRDWQIAYLGKIREIIQLVRQHRARLIIMGPPVVGGERLNGNLKIINKLMAWTCQKSGVCYVNTRIILADSRGEFRMQGALRNGQMAVLRTPDQIHITADGNRKVMEYLLPCLAVEIQRAFSGSAPPPTPASSSAPRRGGAGISGGSGARPASTDVRR